MALYVTSKRSSGEDFGGETGVFPVSEVDFDPDRTSMWTTVHRTGRALRRWRAVRTARWSVGLFVLVGAGLVLVGLSFLFGAHLIA